jgi:hypothetical protein
VDLTVALYEGQTPKQLCGQTMEDNTTGQKKIQKITSPSITTLATTQPSTLLQRIIRVCNLTLRVAILVTETAVHKHHAHRAEGQF